MTEERAARRRANKKFAAGTAAGVVVGSLVVVGALNLVQPRAGTVATPRPSTPAGAPSAPSAPVPAEPVPLPGSPTPVLPSTPSADPTSAAPTTPAPTSAAPAPDQVVTKLPRMSYVAVFQWLPKSKYSAAQAVAAAADNQKGGLQVVAIEGSLIQKPGNYGLGVVNLADFSAASSACRTMGFSTTGKDCFRRAVTG